jgi:uncharacterized membrane protein
MVKFRIKTRVINLFDKIRGTFWFIPAIMILIAVGIAVLAFEADARVSGTIVQELFFLLRIDQANVHSTLTLLSTTEIGVIGVVFSITLVPLTIAISSYGSIVLRAFMRDIGTQIVLGTFSAAIIYNIVILRFTSYIPARVYGPQVSVTIAFAFFLLCLAMLLYFFHHVANSLQASNIIAYLGTELEKSIVNEFPPAKPGSVEVTVDEQAEVQRRIVMGEGIPIRATRTGYIRAINFEELMHTARENNQVFLLQRSAGKFVARGDTLLLAWPDHPGTHGEKALNKAFFLGTYRTMIQDTDFGLSLLLNIASRALSPAVNDPTSPVMCLDRMGVALGAVAERTMPSPYQYDEAHQLRIIADPVTFDHLAGTAFNQIRQYGRENADLLLHMLGTITVIASRVRVDNQRQVLLMHARLIEQDSHIGLPSEYDRQRVRDAYEETVRAIGIPNTKEEHVTKAG